MPNKEFPIKIDPKTGKVVGFLKMGEPSKGYAQSTQPFLQIDQKTGKVIGPMTPAPLYTPLPKPMTPAPLYTPLSKKEKTTPQAPIDQREKVLEEAKKQIEEMQGKLTAMQTELAKRVSPTTPANISASSMGKLFETEMKPINEAFEKFSADIANLQQAIGGGISDILALHQSEMDARKAAIEKQYLEQKQALEAAEAQAGKEIERGWERLGLRNIIIGKQLEDLTSEESRVAAEFSKAYAMLDALKEEALTQATATQRAEDWNRLATILNTKMNLINQQMGLWQSYQNAKLGLRQQLLSEFVTSQQLEEAKKTRATSDLEILLKPYVGTGQKWENLPQDVRDAIAQTEKDTGLPMVNIAKQMISSVGRDLELKSVGNQAIIWDKATGKIIQSFTKPSPPTTFEKKLSLNLEIDKIGKEIKNQIQKDKPEVFIPETGQFKKAEYFRFFINQVAQNTGASYPDVLARFDPSLYISPEDKEGLERMREEFEKYLKISSSHNPFESLFSEIANYIPSE